MKTTLLGLFCIALFTTLHSQTPITGKSFELNDNGLSPINDNNSYIYEASDYINLLPSHNSIVDFEYSSRASGETFIGRITNNLTHHNTISSPFSNVFSNQARSWDPSNKVGTVPGSYSVSEIGSFNYSIPIEIPAGSNGVQPNLSISYSSSGGDGILGEGWALNGLSSVSRVSKSKYYDGATEPINYDNDDAFAIDGNRLIRDGQSHYIEGENYIEYKGFFTNGRPNFWYFRGRDGSTTWYGNTNDSKLSYGSNVMSWLISKFEDNNKNYITYKYKNENGQVLIDEINYTGNAIANKSPHSKIKFIYEKKQHVTSQYFHGYEIKDEYVLAKIITYTKGSPVLQYSFKYQEKQETYTHYNNSYQTTNFKSLQLKAIELKSMINGDEYHSTIFQYNKAASKSISGNEFTSLKKNDQFSTFILGDFNGDGATDVGDFEVNTFTGFITSYNREFNLGGGNFQNVGTNLTFSSTYPLDLNEYWDAFNKTIRSTDLDGDNDDDIIINQEVNGNTYVKRLLDATIDGNYMNIDENEAEFLSFAIGDYSGDGIPDGIGCYYKKIGTDYHIEFYLKDFVSQSGGTQDVIDGSSHPLMFTYSKRLAYQNRTITPFDYDGDGTIEILFWKEYGGGIQYTIFDIVESQSPSLDYELVEISSNTFMGYKRLSVADYNGDGISDFILFNSSNQQALVKHDGIGNFTTQSLAFSSSSSDKWFSLDVNGDRKTDLVRLFVQSGNTGFVVCYSDGKDYTEHRYANISQNLSALSNFSFGDFNGDNALDLFYVEHKTNDGGFANTYTPNVRYFASSPKKFKLHRIRNGFNQDIEVFYNYNSSLEGKFNYLNNTNGSYFDGNTSTHPLSSGNIYLNKQVLLTSRIEQSVSPANLSNYSFYGTTEKFKYDGIIYNREGKGIIGLLGKGTRKPYENKNYANTYTFKPNCNCVVPDESKVYPYPIKSPNNPIETTTYSYQVSNLMGGKRHLIQKTSETYDNELNGISTTKTFTYYNFGLENGNLKDVTTITANYQEINSFEYAQFGYSYRPEHVTKITTTKDNSNHIGTYSTITKFDYFSNGNLENKISHFNTAKQLTASYTYDDFGNALTTTTSSSGMQDLVSTNEYDEEGRFLEWTENHKGQRTEFEMLNSFGIPRSITSIDGNVTKFEYDGFGRKTAEISADGIMTEYVLDWVIDGVIKSERLYYTEVLRPGSPTKTSYYDFLQRELETKVDGWNDKIITTTEYYFIPYNNSIPYSGNHPPKQRSPQTVKRKSLPQFEQAGSNPNYIEYEYDDYYRLTKVDHPFKGEKNIWYHAPQASTNNLYQVYSEDFNSDINKAKRYNAAGELAEVLDHPSMTNITTNGSGDITDFDLNSNNTIEYSYNDQGLQVSVDINSNTVASFEYDPITGEQTKLIDANAGETTYSYDNYGNLVSQTDNKGTTTLTYNNYNELISETSPVGTITYTYINQGNGLNKVNTVTHSNGYEESYIYDGLNRMVKNSIEIDGDVYQYEYTYDANSRIKSKTFPSDFKVDFHYDGVGNLTKKSSPTLGNLWEAVDMNQFGQYTEIKKGNGITSTYNFDEIGLPDDQSGGLNLDYTFNQTTGNLEDRTNNHTSNLEDFDYDSYDRLKEIVLNSSTTKTIAYKSDESGNIDSKDDLTNYQYLNTKPNALQSLKDPNGNISQLDQNISYNALHQPEYIEEDRSLINSGLKHKLEFTYGPDGNRIKSVYKKDGNINRTRYYLPNFEKQLFAANGKEQLIHYISGGDGMAAIYVIEDGVGSVYYPYTDYLGSILRITDDAGSNIAEQSFDAWGRKRNPANLSYSSIPSVPDWLYRGYTGHEYYDEFELINMNGRMYDPIVGRMLSVDNFVQDPTNTQSYNRYSYVLNNPFKYTDPSGENWLRKFAFGFEKFNRTALTVGLIAGAVVTGGAVGGIVNTAIAGGAGVSTGFIAGFATGAAGGAASGFISGASLSVLNGDNSDALKVGLNNAWKQGLSGGITGGVFGGLDAVSKGRDFWTGNAKQFKGSEALYASLDGGSEIYYDTDEYSVFNQSGKDVYYKPEDGAYGISNKIKDGYGIKIDVDGIATSKYSKQVFKIPGQYGFSPNSVVNNGGDVKLNFGPLDAAALKFQQLRNPNYHFGWSYPDQLDDSWNTLFELAKKIR